MSHLAVPYMQRLFRVAGLVSYGEYPDSGPVTVTVAAGQLVGGAPAHGRQHIALLDERAHPAPNPPTWANMDHGRRWASYSERCLGSGFGASAASITRHSLAPSPSSGGGRTLPATNYGLPHAAPVAAAKVRPSSIQAGLAIMLASVRFRPASGSGNQWRCVICEEVLIGRTRSGWQAEHCPCLGIQSPGFAVSS